MSFLQVAILLTLGTCLVFAIIAYRHRYEVETASGIKVFWSAQELVRHMRALVAAGEEQWIVAHHCKNQVIYLPGPRWELIGPGAADLLDTVRLCLEPSPSSLGDLDD